MILSTGIHLEKNSGLKQPLLKLMEPTKITKVNTSITKMAQLYGNIDLRDPRLQKVVKCGVLA